MKNTVESIIHRKKQEIESKGEFEVIQIFEKQAYYFEVTQDSTERALAFAANLIHPEEARFLLTENGKITGALSIYDCLEKRSSIGVLEVASIEESMERQGRKNFLQEMFNMARERFHSSHSQNHAMLPVLERNGSLRFLLEFCTNQFFGEKKEGMIYEEYWDLGENEDFVDHTLLDRYDTFVFLEWNEYTVYIAQKILDTQTKKVLFFDGKAKEYLENIQVCGSKASLFDIVNAGGKVMYIHSLPYNEYGIVPAQFSGVYNVFCVLKSMLWCKKLTHPGKKEPDQKILLLDYDISNSGLVDIVKFTLLYANIARQRGFLPVVDIKDDNGYLIKEKQKNVWEVFFSPLDKIFADEVQEYANVFRASINHIRLVDWEMNPYLYEMDAMLWDACKNSDITYLTPFFSFFHPKKECIQKVLESRVHSLEQGMEATDLEWKKILGVIARGTDYRKEAVESRGCGDYVRNVPADLLLSETKAKYSMESFDYVFLATEDAEYFALFGKELGDKLLYIPQKRGKISSKDQYVAEILKSESPKEQTIAYMQVLYQLSKCEKLISSMDCGAYFAALFLKMHRKANNILTDTNNK